MPPFGPVSRRVLIRCLRQAGFDGPFAGGRHEYMTQHGRPPLQIPNPHQSDIGPNLLSKLLKQAGISRDEWERL